LKLCLNVTCDHHPMHIGLLVPDLSLNNGWATYSLNLITALQRRGVTMTIIAARNCPDVRFEVQRWLPTVTPPDKNTLLQMLRLVPQVRAAFRQCDVIHATAEPYAPLAAWVRGARPMFITAHGSYVNLPRVQRFPINRLYGWAFRQSTLICVSQYTARIAQEVVPGIKTVVVNNAVEAGRFTPPHRAVSTRPNPLPEFREGASRNILNKPIILATGGVKTRKGTLPLIRALAKIREKIPTAQVVVTGSLTQEPQYVAQVRAEIERLNLRDGVHLPGFVSDEELRAWYAAADVFALPSVNQGWKFEGFGLVHLEASAAGLPVVGTRDCGAEDAIEHGVTGLLVNQARLDEELPDAILTILQNPQLAAQMGAAGRIKAQAQTWDHVAEQVLAAYSSAP
jgi:phosphatidyl-myo-inositol dimannoside synthase